MDADIGVDILWIPYILITVTDDPGFVGLSGNDG